MTTFIVLIIVALVIKLSLFPPQTIWTTDKEREEQKELAHIISKCYKKFNYYFLLPFVALPFLIFAIDSIYAKNYSNSGCALIGCFVQSDVKGGTYKIRFVIDSSDTLVNRQDH